MGVLTNVPELPKNIIGPIEYFDWVKQVAPLFWPVLLSALAIIVFVRSLNYGASRALIIAGFIPGIFGIIISVLGWMDPKWMYLFGIIVAAGIFWRNLESGQIG